MVDADLVFQSYGRSCNKAAFYQAFYSEFMNQSDEIRALFKDTNMDARRGLLRGGIMWLVMHARGMSDSKIRALGESHSRKKMNIHPNHYGLWVNALMTTLARHDPEFTPQLEQTWRATITPSIELIQSLYKH